MREFFEFCAADQPLPKPGSAARHARITVMIELTKIESFKVGEKRIAFPQGGIMDTQISLDNFPPCLDGLEPVESSGTIAIVATQIGK